MIKILTFSLLVLALSAAISPSMAQDEPAESQYYDPTHLGNENEAAKQILDAQRASLSDKGFIIPNEVQVTVVHEPFMEEDQFGIQMAVPDVISGCYTLTPLEYEAKFTPPHYLDIRVKKYRRVAPEGSAAMQKCSTQNQMSSALMVLSKKDLQEKGTQEIRFSTPGGADNYKIILGENQLELIPQSMMTFRPQNMAGPLKDRIIYSFTNDKMIALQVPMANPGEDLTSEIVRFAQTRALTPANPSAPASWSGNGTAVYYFYDQDGRFLSQIGNDGYAEIGQVAATRPYDGPDGRTTTTVPLSVFATRPGTQL